MMAAFILVFSLAALLQFFVSYCRSLIASSARLPLSPEVQDVTGISSTASGEDYLRVMQLLLLCPERIEDRGGIRAVGAYYRLLSFLRRTFVKMVPSLSLWTERERAHCAYFAAVALDRRIAFSRNMLAQQLDS
jgi:hypothetical protein